MSDEMRDFLARALLARPEPSATPRVIRDGGHVIVQGPSAPLSVDFVSSGRRPARVMPAAAPASQ